MTIAPPALGVPRKHKIDLSWPILILFAAVLCVLIILPMSWLFYYSLVDRPAPSRSQFRRRWSPIRFVDPLITTLILATSSSIICCAFAAPMGWLVARTDIPLRRTVRALVTASFVTRRFSAPSPGSCWRRPTAGLQQDLPRRHRRAAGRVPLQHLFAPGPDLRHLLLHLPLCVRARQRARPHSRRLEDASSILGGRTWTTARRVTIPLALPALLAGALVAFLQAMTLFACRRSWRSRPASTP